MARVERGWIGDADDVLELLWLLLTAVLAWARPRHDLVLENQLLRHQLALLTRATRTRPRARLRTSDKPLANFRQTGPAGLSVEHTGGSPPTLSSEQQAELKAAVQAPPPAAGIELADWTWKVVREFVQRRFGHTLSRGSCLQYLHRLDLVRKRPKKRLAKPTRRAFPWPSMSAGWCTASRNSAVVGSTRGQRAGVHFASGLDHGLEITHPLAHLDLQAAALKCTLDHRV